jgi:3-hydroxyisobutyrate dehydrogenase-like beta-hydroxyacid dehydrogenase
VRVGLVGLGLLGHAIASRLLAAGREVTGFDVVAEKNAQLAAMGGRAVGSLADVTRASDLVCIVLPSLASVEDAILGADGVLAHAGTGQVIAQMSTISSVLTERLAAAAPARGVDFLDCPVSGTSGMVARGDGLFMVGGARAVVERVTPVLRAVLPKVIHVGRAGQAMTLKLIANLLVALNSAAAAEALTMARKAGLDPGRVVEMLAGGAATSRMLEVRGPMIARREFPAEMKLELFMKDLHLILDEGRRVGASLPLTSVAERLFDQACSAGHGGEDLAVVAALLESGAFASEIT